MRFTLLSILLALAFVVAPSYGAEAPPTDPGDALIQPPPGAKSVTREQIDAMAAGIHLTLNPGFIIVAILDSQTDEIVVANDVKESAKTIAVANSRFTVIIAKTDGTDPGEAADALDPSCVKPDVEPPKDETPSEDTPAQPEPQDDDAMLIAPQASVDQAGDAIGIHLLPGKGLHVALIIRKADNHQLRSETAPKDPAHILMVANSQFTVFIYREDGGAIDDVSEALDQAPAAKPQSTTPDNGLGRRMRM